MSELQKFSKGYLEKFHEPRLISGYSGKVCTDACFMMLEEIPSEDYRVTIKGYNEVLNLDDIENENDFYVDYTNNYIYFHKSKLGKTITVDDYYGIGLNFIGASRIIVRSNVTEDVIQTLEDLIEQAKLCLEAITTLGGATEVIEQLKEDTETGRKVDEQLQDTIESGKTTVQAIKDTGNKSFIVNKTDWTSTTNGYKYTLTHNLQSINLHVSMIDLTDNMAYPSQYKIIDVNKIEVYAIEQIKANIVISAKYYNGLGDNVGDKIVQEVVDARGGMTSLGDKIRDMDNQLTTEIDNVNTSLEEKMEEKMDKNTVDISVTQINKNLGKFDETYMSESLLAKMTGEGTFGVIPEDKSITNIKLASKSVKVNNTDFIKTKNNDLLLNISFIYDKYISYNDGNEVSSTTYKCTDYVPVSEGQRLITNESNNFAYYDDSKVFVGGQQGGTWNKVIVVPNGVSFIRLTYTKNANAYLYESSEDTLYSLETLITNTEMEKLIKRLSAKSNNDIPVIKNVYETIYQTNNLVDYDTLIKGGYYTKDGWQENPRYNSSIFIKVDSLTTYTSNETNIVVMYDKDLLPIKQLKSSSQWESGRKFTTTKNTKYITVNYISTNEQPLLCKADVQSTDRYINTSFIDLLINSLVDKNKRLKLKSIEPFNVVKDATNIYEPSLDEAVNTAINSNTGKVYVANGYQASGYIKINNAYVCMAQTHNTAFYDANKTYISGVTGGWSNPLSVPENAKYLRTTFKIDTEKLRQINEGNVLLSYEDPERVNITLDDSQTGLAFQRLLGNNPNKLDGIVWNVLGDSITSTNYSRPNWWEILKDKYNVTVNNYGISGTTLAHTHDRHLWDYNFGRLDADSIGYIQTDSSTWSTGNCMCERYSKMDDNADLITVMGSTNDSDVPLGDWDSTDTSTFYGALNELITGLIKKYPDKKIAFFTPIQKKNSYTTNVANPSAELDKKQATDTTTLQLKAEAIKRKCNQYAIPCLDLFNTSGINGVEGRDKLLYRTGDNLHPSVTGNEWIARVVENFILSLFN